MGSKCGSILGVILEWVPVIQPFTGGGPSAFPGGAENGQNFFSKLQKIENEDPKTKSKNEWSKRAAGNGESG